MTASAQITISASIGGKQVYKSFTRTADHPNVYQDIPLPAGKEVTDWVKTDANTAACNLPAGHGFSDGKMDVYWTESGVAKQRHGVDGTIVTNALSLDGGAGDDFPASATEDIVVNEQVSINVQCDGDTAVAMLVCAEFDVTSETAYCGADFQDVTPATVKFFHLPPNEPQVWTKYCFATNPLTGNVIEECKASNGSATNDATLQILILEDAT